MEKEGGKGMVEFMDEGMVGGDEGGRRGKGVRGGVGGLWGYGVGDLGVIWEMEEGGLGILVVEVGKGGEV